jgi:hypothetical protein
MDNQALTENLGWRFSMQRTPQKVLTASLAFLLIAGLFGIFTLRIYPTGDDGWYELCKRQGGGANELKVSDRPLSSYIIRLYDAASGSSPIGLVMIHTILWMLLAVESYCLSILLWRANFQEAVVAALFTLAPVIVKCGVVTITYDPSVVVPVILAYGGGLLYMWNLKRTIPTSLCYVVALSFCFIAGLISEYGVCAGLACATFLLIARRLKTFPEPRRTLRAGVAMFVVSVLSYVCFILFFAQLEAGSKKNIVSSFESGRLDILSALPNTFSHLIFLMFGSVASQFGSLQYEADSKSTLLAFAVGCITSLLIYFCTKANSNHHSQRLPNLYLGVIAALVVAISPFMLTGRNVFEHYLNTRYFVPALPFAVIGILFVGSSLLSLKGYRIFLLALAFLCGHETVTHLTSVLRQEQKIATLGKVLEPYVRNSEGITIFVLAREKNSAISLTGKATMLWSRELCDKTWIIPETEAHLVYGLRKSPDQPEQIKLDHRGLVKEGPLAAIYYVDISPSNEVLIEPYSKR